jgi:hypothetical protein
MSGLVVVSVFLVSITSLSGTVLSMVVVYFHVSVDLLLRIVERLVRTSGVMMTMRALLSRFLRKSLG